MPGYSDSMLNLIKELGRLPGIGEKSAERLAYHILRSSKEDALKLARAVRDVKEKLRHCSICYNMGETDPCHICSDVSRDRSIVCVVEEPKDLLALEGTGGYRGVYHVLGGRIAPLEGLDPEKLTVTALVERVKSEEVREVILALNPNMEGDLTAHYVHDRLKPTGVRVTQIARGIPPGSQLEYASEAILSDALKGRREID
ncbi:MAG TPA: recombination mediator RecR [Planctomycetota bacterium]|nr:recombination mediator RecR [Planctomycetota bacterium]HUV39731.1 recombination mediator RecR [Planctomycetota bacterium]